jgi:ubiquinol-cytochrome c reductase cytochrome b subunit
MYSYHVFLLPLAVVGLVAAHVLLVRRHGVVPPFELDRPALATRPPQAGGTPPAAPDHKPPPGPTGVAS